MNNSPIFYSFDIKNKIKTILDKTINTNNQSNIIITYITWNNNSNNNNNNIWNIIKNEIQHFIINNYIFDTISIDIIKQNNNIISYEIHVLKKTYILHFKTIILDSITVLDSLNKEFDNYCIQTKKTTDIDYIPFHFKLTDYISITFNNKTDELYKIQNINNYDSLKIILTLLANKIVLYI